MKTIWSRNPKHTLREGYKASLKEDLKESTFNFHNKLQLNEAALSVTEAIREAFEANCQSKPNHSKPGVPWWNKELAKLRMEVRKAFNKARSSGLPAHWET